MTNNNERLIGNRLGLRIEVFSFFGVSLNVKQQQTEKENKGKPFWHRGTQPSWHRGPAAILATSEKSVAKAIPSAGCGTERNGAVSVCVHIALYGVVPIKARPSVLISRLSLRLFVKIIRSLFKSMSSLDGCTAHRNGAPSSRAKKTGFFLMKFLVVVDCGDSVFGANDDCFDGCGDRCLRSISRSTLRLNG